MQLEPHFDKLLLFALFIILIGVAIYFQTHNMDEGSSDWARSKGDMVLGALLGYFVKKTTDNVSSSK